MKISEILKQNKRTISFEVFPPKTESVFDSIRSATEEIATMSPAFMSVTYGAGGGTSKYTLDIAENIEKKFLVPTLAHLTCVSSSRETVRRRIADLRSSGIENVMALRGDIPADMIDSDRSGWDFHHATDLIAEIRAFGGDFCIGGACYPEIHPESPDRASDLEYLKAKQDAGCDFLTTQMFFDNALYYGFVDMARASGVSIPVIPGIMPITRASQVERAISLSHSYMPNEFLSLVDKYRHNNDDMAKAGIEYATRQIIDLYESGVKNVHVYSMNKPEVARAILNNLVGII